MSVAPKHKVKFIKMNGAGNDFVIFDARNQEVNLNKEEIIKISDRKNIGCDQLIIIRKVDDADCLMEIYNSDGSLSGACGNATRCVAAIINQDSLKIKTAAGFLKCWREGNLISVDMGKPKFLAKEIPLAKEIDSQNISFFGLSFACVNVGNPHAVTFVKKLPSDEEFFKIAPQIESEVIFSQKTNVEFAKIISDNLLEVRVWERATGETLACGSGACAVAILAIKNGLVKSKKLTTRFKGGDLIIEWNGESVIMTGGFEKNFEGEINL